MEASAISDYIEDLISIITPVHNGEKYIGECVESVLGQIHNNWELIIVNDNSVDRTKEVIEYYSCNEPRIKLINMEINCGVAKARNIALDVAKGRYVAFLDSDDFWKIDKLSKQLAFMKKNNYSFTYTGYDCINDESKKTFDKIKIPLRQNRHQSLKNTAIGCLTVMIDRETVGAFEMPDLRHGEDHFTWISIMKRGFDAHGLNENLAVYRLSSNSLSSNKVDVLRRQWSNYRYFEKLSLLESVYYFSCYIFNATRKHLKIARNTKTF